MSSCCQPRRRGVLSTLVGFLSFAFFLHLLLRTGSYGADKDPALAKLKEMLGLEVKKAVPVKKKLGPEAKAKVETALGEPLESADVEPYLYEVDGLTNPDTGEGMKVRACLTVAKGPSGPIRLGLALDPRGAIFAARCFEHAEKVDFPAEEFCQQFVGASVTPSSYRSPKELEATLAKVKQPDADQVPELLRAKVLLGIREQMETNGSRTGDVKERLSKKDARAAEAADALSKSLRLVEALVGKLSPYKPEQTAALAGIAGKTRQAAEDVRDLAKKNDWAGATKAFKDRLQDGCEKCHDWNDPLSNKKFYDAARWMRGDVGVGDGYWVVGHDCHAASEPSRALSQAVATGLKKALLLLDQTK